MKTQRPATTPYDPGIDLHTRYPEWTVDPAARDSITFWAIFNPVRERALVNAELHARDPDLVMTYVVAMLDAGHIYRGMGGISEQAQRDAADVAALRLGRDIIWSPADGEVEPV